MPVIERLPRLVWGNTGTVIQLEYQLIHDGRRKKIDFICMIFAKKIRVLYNYIPIRWDRVSVKMCGSNK